jgi:streptogramin lyase
MNSTVKSTLLTTSLLASMLTSAAFGQAHFKSNRLFVLTAATGAEAIHEIDYSIVADGGGGNTSTLVRTFGLGDLVEPWALAFGPNGNLYVSGNNPASPTEGRVLVYDPTGTLVGSPISSVNLQSARGIAFGPNGHLYVCSSGNGVVLEFDEDGVFVQNIGVGAGMNSPTGIVVGPNGSIFVSCPPQNTVYEFSPFAATMPIRLITAAGNLNLPRGMFVGPRGHLYVANAGNNQIIEIDENGSFVLAINAPLVQTPGTAAIGYDSHIYVPSEATDKIIVLNGDETPVGSPFDTLVSMGSPNNPFTIDGPRAAAFSPQRWGVTIKGNAFPSNAAKVKVNEVFAQNSGPILSWAAGSRFAFLTVVDGAGDKDLATLLGTDTYSFAGFQTMQDVDSALRAFAGNMIPEPNLDTGTATIVIRPEGKANPKGQYVTKEFGGRLVRQARNVIFDGNVVSVKLLNK